MTTIVREVAEGCAVAKSLGYPCHVQVSFGLEPRVFLANTEAELTAHLETAFGLSPTHEAGITAGTPLDETLKAATTVFQASGLSGKTIVWKDPDIKGYGHVLFVLTARLPGRNGEPEQVILEVRTAPGSKLLHAAACLEDSGRILKLEPVRAPTPENGKLHAENLVAWWEGQALVQACDAWDGSPPGFAAIVYGALGIGVPARDLAAEFEVSESVITRWASGHGRPRPLVRKWVVSRIRTRAVKGPA